MQRRRPTPALVLPLITLVALALFLLRSVINVPPLRAAPALLANPWQGTILLQNRSSAAGNVLVDYYNIATQSIASGASTVRTIPGFGSLAIPLSSNGSLPNGPYSAILSADIPLASVVLEESGTDAAMAYTPNPPATRLYFPWVRNASAPDWVTRLYLQATDNGSATITFRDMNGNVGATSTISLPAGIAVEVVPPSGLVSAEVSSSVPLLGVARRVHDGDARAMAYPAATSPRATIYFPLVHSGGSSGTARLLIQNIDNVANTVAWRFFRIDNGQEAAQDSRTIDPGATLEVYSPDASVQFSAAVRATRSDGTVGRIVGLALLERTDMAASQAYIGFNRGNTPLYLRFASGWSTLLAVQNADTADASGTITYYADDGTVVGTSSFALGPGRARLFAPNGTSPAGAAIGALNGKILVGVATAFRGSQTVTYEATRTGIENTVGVYRSAFFYQSNNNVSSYATNTFPFGTEGDIPVAGDWDCNGTTTVGIFRNGQWHLRNTNSPGAADVIFDYGAPGDLPVVGDWDGDGCPGIGVFRNGQWHLRNAVSPGPAQLIFWFGAPSDIPAPGDWDCNGTTTVGIFRNGQWHLRNTNSPGAADVIFDYGAPGDLPVVGDWDGDGCPGIGVFRNGQWHLRNAVSPGPAQLIFWFGAPSDVPTVGNWDG